MRFHFASVDLTPDGSPAANIRINGARVIDEVDGAQRLAKSFFSRGNRSTSIAFEASYEFASLQLAEVYALTLNTLLVEVGTLEVICGTGAGQSVFFDSAALTALPQIAQGGVRIAVAYELHCGLATTTILPDLPTPSLTADPMILRNETAIPNGASQIDVTWLTQAAAPVTVNVNLVIPDSAGSIIPIVEQLDQRTASGTRFVLASATPATGYKASWTAIF